MPGRRAAGVDKGGAEAFMSVAMALSVGVSSAGAGAATACACGGADSGWGVWSAGAAAATACACGGAELAGESLMDPACGVEGSKSIGFISIRVCSFRLVS